MGYATFGDVRRYAREVGLEAVGVTSAEPLVRDGERLAVWQRKGHAAGLGYMMRDPSLLSAPRAVYEEAKTILLVSVSYDRFPLPERPEGMGRVARYAWGRDYHRVLKRRLKALLDRVRRDYPQVEGRVFADAFPLMERPLAARAGLGFIGKHTLLIRPPHGTFSLLGGILWNLVVVQEALPQISGTCGSCFRCGSACPTGAIEEPYVVNAGRCISYLTIEKRGSLTVSERRAIGEWIFGCDICQEVCPFNHRDRVRGERAVLPELGFESGAGPLLDLAEVLSLSTDLEYSARFAGTPLMRAKREGLLRNASVVAVNTDAVSLVPMLRQVAVVDLSAVVRQHALWAAVVLGTRHNALSLREITAILDRARLDPAPVVRDEALQLLEHRDDAQ